VGKLNSEQNQVVYVIVMITIMALATFLSMKLISPYSKALGHFLFGFAGVFIFVILLALYLKYIFELYKEIRSFR
jgi:hypothetical protein